MKYTTVYNGKEQEIQIKNKGNHLFEITINDETHEADARLCGPDSLSILLNRTSYDISYTLEEPKVHLHFRNRHYDIEVLDERRLRMRSLRSKMDLSGPETIKTSMPGKVVKILVKEGDTVPPDSGIIIIEAMKMENEIRTRAGGRIKSIHAAPGQTVESGFTLVEIEPVAEE